MVVQIEWVREIITGNKGQLVLVVFNKYLYYAVVPPLNRLLYNTAYVERVKLLNKTKCKTVRCFFMIYGSVYQIAMYG